MSTPKDGGLAFPRPSVVLPENDNDVIPGHTGMSLRDYFAAAALPGIIIGAVVAGMGSTDDNTYETCALRAYAQADAMIKQGRTK
jgi:hypothetical protein